MAAPAAPGVGVVHISPGITGGNNPKGPAKNKRKGA